MGHLHSIPSRFPPATYRPTQHPSLGLHQLPHHNSTWQLAVCGDVMLGRVVDQTLPHPLTDEFEHGRSISEYGESLREAYHWNRYTEQQLCDRVWGDTLPYLRSCDLRIINLETSVTKHSEKFPNKVFNYRMNPDNIGVLTTARIDYCSLANNHIIDYGRRGMEETVHTLDRAGIRWAGVGNNSDEAFTPTSIPLPDGRSEILAFSFSDHGCGCSDSDGNGEAWAATPRRSGFNYVDVESMTDRDRTKLAIKIKRTYDKYIQTSGRTPDSVVCMVSFHWGPNYSWIPREPIILLAHKMIDEGGVDIIHGHSAHHIQGIEIYKGKPILYGCGDFLDDYAVDDQYRNDLGMVYTLHTHTHAPKVVSHITLRPTKVKKMAVHFLKQGGNETEKRESEWVFNAFSALCEHFGTNVYQMQSEEPLFMIPVTRPLELAQHTTAADMRLALESEGKEREREGRARGATVAAGSAV